MMQILHDKVIFNGYDNANEIFEQYLLIEVNERRRPDLGELNDVIE